jgi:hypothetical protein
VISPREEHALAGRNRPSFLKKQKEEQRRARANRKREERRARKHATQLGEPDPMTLDGAPEPGDVDALDEVATDQDAADEDATEAPAADDEPV